MSGPEKPIASLMPLTLSLDDVMAMAKEDLEVVIAAVAVAKEATARIPVEGETSKITQSLVVQRKVMTMVSISRKVMTLFC